MGKDKNAKVKEAEVNANNQTTKEEEVQMSNPEINNVPEAEVIANTQQEDVTMNYSEDVLRIAQECGMDPEDVVSDMEVIDSSAKRGGGNRSSSGRWAQTREFVIRQLKIAAATGRKTFFFGDMVRACINPRAQIWSAWKYNGKTISAAEVRAMKIPENQLKVVSDIADKQMRYRQCMNYIRNNFLSLSGDEGSKVGKAKDGLPPGWTIRYTEGGKGNDALAFVYKG